MRKIIHAIDTDHVESALSQEFDIHEHGVKEAIGDVVAAAERGEREIYSDFLDTWVDVGQ